MLLDAQLSQLVLVDYQEKLMPAMHNAAPVLANAMRLAQAAQWIGVPVWGTEQCPQKLGGNAPELRALCRQTVAKLAFSGVHEGLLDLVRPPVRASGNARSLPRHLQKKQDEPAVGQTVVICWLRSAYLPAANGAGVDGGRVRGVGGDGCLQLTHRSQPRCRF